MHMPISDLPGYQEVHRRYGPVRAREFDDLVSMHYERCSGEGEEPEFSLKLVTRGDKGLLQWSLGNVVMFKIGRTRQLYGLEVDDISDRGWDRKRYKLYSIE